jgi:isopentenyl diphosphate isomerase/L-lactate dehydrogenase-like FMN-dependent dehydrogenase
MLKPDGSPMLLWEAAGAHMMRPPTWDDVPWVRERFGGPVIVKGILSAEDARRAVDAGADAIVVSNHGGMTVDGTPASLTVLPEVVAAVGDRVEVLLDSGVRRGPDVVKALALGARAVLIGRSYVWALAAGGTDGVTKILDYYRQDIAQTLKLIGCPSVGELDHSWLRIPEGWAAPPVGASQPNALAHDTTEVPA